jgi:phosphoribosyl-ATP pyrophosphohydrolase/phosphoribosyl-AMP cyclohydrolase
MKAPETTPKFGEDGLVPCIVQSTSGEVRMLAYMNAEAYERTLSTGRVTFFSRSRGALWVKGETSGHTLTAEDVRLDCDGDAVLVRATCVGPTCHRETPSCFSVEGEPEGSLVPARGLAFLGELEGTLRERHAARRADGSYTERLFFQGIDRIAKKVVEEAGEVVIAAKNVAERPGEAERAELFGEAADLLVHLDMLLVASGASLEDAVRVLRERHTQKTRERG